MGDDRWVARFVYCPTPTQRQVGQAPSLTLTARGAVILTLLKGVAKKVYPRRTTRSKIASGIAPCSRIAWNCLRSKPGLAFASSRRRVQMVWPIL